MKRTVLAIAFTVLPFVAAAQDTAAPTSAAAEAAVTAGGAAASDTTQSATPRRSTKRRGSMVGYIEDPSVASQVRVRFDAGFNMTSPDRAEFFYGKCGCYRDLAGNAAYDPDAPGPGPGLLQGLDYQQFNVLGEFAFNHRVSVFAELPVRSIKPTDFVPGTGSFGNQSGIGDINAGVKLSLFSSDTSDATVMVRTSMPSGDAGKGLGTDHGSIEPAFLFRQDLGDRAGLEGQFGYWHPTSSSKGPLPGNGDFAGNIVYYGIGPSFDLVRTDTVTFSPVVELIGWHVLSGYQTSTFLTDGGNASGINIANLKIGARTTVKGNSFYVGYGFALTNNDWYDKILRLEYRARF
jgi:hypothetical protein